MSTENSRSMSSMAHTSTSLDTLHECASSAPYCL